MRVICHWWGLSNLAVTRWRRAFGIGRMDTPGRRRLIRDVALGGLNARRKYLYHDVRMWTPEELGWLESAVDAEVAERTERSPKAVREMRRLVEGQCVEGLHATISGGSCGNP